ncbi:putative transcription factor MYB-HB-like family [Dioscorea sansibarensis]
MELRKGPWTEKEDLQLVCYVGLFGERRWDFIAKVSGLNRTGKSCRLRWVNYLHPGLKRGRMSPQEERLVLELHSHWGNRWSRIARRLPGRTDNEIKNYWRTHMRKKAQERKKNLAGETNASASTTSTTSTTTTTDNTANLTAGFEDEVEGYPIDKIWNELSCDASPVWDEQLWNLDDGEELLLNSMSDCLVPLYQQHS